jgi:hypothetical protein
MCTSLLKADAAAENIPDHFREFHPIASVPSMQQAATPEAGMRNVVAVLQPDEYAQSGECIR